MKLRLLTGVLIIITVFLACNETGNKLYLNHKKFIRDVESDSITIMGKKYFEIDLYHLEDKSLGYSAMTNTKNDIIDGSIHYYSLRVCDKDGTEFDFKSPVDFLNFMSERGFEVSNSKESVYSINYLFKQKE